MNRNVYATVFFLLLLSAVSSADFQTSLSFIRANVYAVQRNDGQRLGWWGNKKVYMRYCKYDGALEIQPEGNDFIYYNAMQNNWSFINDEGVYIKIYKNWDYLQYADSLYKLEYKDSLLFYYIVGKTIKMEHIYSISVDTILWPVVGDHELWVDDTTAAIFQKKKVIFLHRWVSLDDPLYYSVNAISFDTSWTKQRYVELFNSSPFDSARGSYRTGMDFLKYFHPEIQKAIKEKKIFVWERSAP